jgi:hypothetical protein
MSKLDEVARAICGDVSTGTALELAERAVAKATRAEGAASVPASLLNKKGGVER